MALQLRNVSKRWRNSKQCRSWSDCSSRKEQSDQGLHCLSRPVCPKTKITIPYVIQWNIYWNDLKTHRFLFVFFHVWRGNRKLKIIQFFCMVIRTLLIDLSVMGKRLIQKWQNHNFEDKTVSKNVFTRFQFTCDRLMHQTKNSIKKSLNFWWGEIFMPVWKFAVFENYPLILKIVINTISEWQQLQWKVKAYTATSFLCRFTILHTSVFCAQI